MKILNLYAGIGGNRKLWGDEHEITAVEFDPKIAAIYQDFFPNDKMIVTDAHQYLLEHYKEFDFIWSSPPCPSHSRFRLLWKGDGSKITGNKISGASMKFPDMKLYEEIIFLMHFYNGKYCIENVISYYKPLIAPTESGNHYYWTNFYFKSLNNKSRQIRQEEPVHKVTSSHYDLSKYALSKRRERYMLNNCVLPEHGLHIFNEMLRSIDQQGSLAI
jgi:DNA (cytosine-5)-methyltransferase 1